MATGPEIQHAEAQTRAMLTAAEENFRGILNALVDLRRRLEAAECDLPEADIRRTLSGVHKAVQAVFDERKKLDDIRKADPGPVTEYTLDLGHAERQIRSRIARLRADLRGDPVPPDAR